MRVLRPIIINPGSRFVNLESVPISDVKLTDRFWAPRFRKNSTVSIRKQYQELVNTGRIDNFLRLSDKSDKTFTEPVFNDSDVYKWLEAAAWSLSYESDQETWQIVDKVIDKVIQAQNADGYLNTFYAKEHKQQRWSNIRDMHELYCAGHLFQAAVALHRSVGDRRLLDCAIRFADYLVLHFGITENNHIIPPGHPEIEMALVELSRETGDRRYLQLAQNFLDARGKGLIGGQEYHQDHLPYRQLQRLTGHAVRALYLSAGATDIAIETGEEVLTQTVQRLWQHMTTHQMYINGGIGSRHRGEAIGRDFELPNAQAYAETCASIAAVMWAWRMLQMDADCQYADYIEHLLYNAILPAVSLDGSSYFYVNPLADDGSHHREPWFFCACCPPNLARILAMLPGMIYSVSEDSIWVHQYAANESTLSLPSGKNITVIQRTRYPWDGNIIVEVLDNCIFDLNLRIPNWCKSNVEININGDKYTGPITPGSYVKISRSWSIGDSVCLQFPMPVRVMKAHPHVRENTGQVALMRGPILFCVEAVDNPNINLLDLVIEPRQKITSSFHPQLLNGVQVLEVLATVTVPEQAWGQSLYRDTEEILLSSSHTQPVTLTAIPYFAWGNREVGQMQIWLQEKSVPGD